MQTGLQTPDLPASAPNAKTTSVQQVLEAAGCPSQKGAFGIHLYSKHLSSNLLLWLFGT